MFVGVRCGSGRSPEPFGGFECHARFPAYAASRFGSRLRVQSARVVVRLAAGAGSITPWRVDALYWRSRSVPSSSFAPRLAPVPKRLGDVATSETSDMDYSVSDASAEPSGRDEPLPSVSVTELAGDWGQFSRLPRYADGSGRSPGTLGQNAALPIGQGSAYTAIMSIEQIAAEALRLPPKDRAVLAESLWESLVDPFKVPAWTDDAEAVALATERDRQLETGQVLPISHEEMMFRLRR